jgi:pectate lyase
MRIALPGFMEPGLRLRIVLAVLTLAAGCTATVEGLAGSDRPDASTVDDRDASRADEADAGSQATPGSDGAPQGGLPSFIRDVAPGDGWAGQEGGTRGGADATDEHVYQVSSRLEVLAALADAGDAAKILVVTGPIDFRDGQEYTSHDDQATRGVLELPSRTTLVGVGAGAGFVATQLTVKGVDSVIVRNLVIECPWDVDPVNGPADAEWDGIVVTGNATHVWVDHVTVSDGSRTKDQDPDQVRHDGALDVTNGASLITISNSVFTLHDKTNLIGSSDSKTTDRGRLKVTLHGNVWEDIGQRAPRVRFGEVHSYNNLLVGHEDHPVYAWHSFLGLGVESRLIAENNVYQVPGLAAGDACDLLDLKGGVTFRSSGSTLNGTSVDLSCGLSAEVGWSPPYAYDLVPAAQVESSVRAHAGAGKLP